MAMYSGVLGVMEKNSVMKVHPIMLNSRSSKMKIHPLHFHSIQNIDTLKVVHEPKPGVYSSEKCITLLGQQNPYILICIELGLST